MSSLSQAPRLEDLPSPHGTFQEHAAHIAKWPAMLSSKGSRGTCLPRGLSTFLQCAFTAHVDHPVGRMPNAPQLHGTTTVRTDQWSWPHDSGSSAGSVLCGQTMAQRVYLRDIQNLPSIRSTKNPKA